MTQPLSADDRAILALESDVVGGHTCKVVRIAPGGFVTADLRRAMMNRLDAVPELTWRLSDDEASWRVDATLDPAWHVTERITGAPIAPADLPALVARIFSERLDRSRPLWRIDVVALADGGHALIWRLHHALADGMTAMRFAREVLWDPAPTLPPPAPRQVHEARRRAHGLAFVHREFAPSPRRSPFDGRIGPIRSVGFASCSLRALHDAARERAGATLNDAVVTVVAGALRRRRLRLGRPLGAVRLRIPVSLHAVGDTARNRDSFFSLGVALGAKSPVARLAAVHAATLVRKAEDDARRREALLEQLERVSPRLEHACLHLEDSPREFALAISNVPGPRSAPTVLGAPVASLHSLAEIGRHHALRVSVVSLADELAFGLCADPAIVPDLAEIADEIEAEAEALAAPGSPLSPGARPPVGPGL